MPAKASNPLLCPLSILLAGLSLSIGWGIRGNYGHETGAMFPGALTAIAVCLLSGRADWRSRVGYFALFGMLGWGFGGSISYMQVIGFTHSGHAPTQLFGFAGLFVIGFLWAALGGAGTALPAVMSRQRLNDLFKPLTWLLLIWCALRFVLFPIMAAVQRYLELDGLPGPMQRQEQGLYWLDSDWFTVLIVLCGILLFDLVERRFEKASMLLLFGVLGTAIGVGGIFLIDQAGWSGPIAERLVQHQGTIGDRFTPEQLAVTNWPPIILHFGSQHKWICPGEILGASLGLMLGVAVYFTVYGRFRCDSGLFLSMAVGWFICFLALPVLGSLFLAEYGGLRMTPPRGDNWAGVLGTFLGANVYLFRHQLKAVVLASIVCGIVGGIGFSGIALVQSMFLSLGNERISDDPQVQQAWTEWHQAEWQPTDWMDKNQRMPTPEFARKLPVDKSWTHFRSQNWHSFLEQSYGFVNGLGVVLAMALLVTRVPPLNDEAPRRRWTEIVAITFALPALTYVNMVKNIPDWTREHGPHRSLPEIMKAPWVDYELSALGWFNLFYAAATIAFVGLMIAHTRRRLSIVPSHWLGRGQLLYFLLAWAFVLGNFSKALPSFAASRLLTEGIILLNAIFATALVLLAPREQVQVKQRPEPNYNRWICGAALLGLTLFIAVPFAERFASRRVYGDARVGFGGINYRFGPNANWKRTPLLKGQKHR